MTDLEITKLCAEAMGLKHYVDMVDSYTFENGVFIDSGLYNPLHDDAQAMALVKRFKLELYCESEHDDLWFVAPYASKTVWKVRDGINHDLNRAICECVAQMQQAK